MSNASVFCPNQNDGKIARSGAHGSPSGGRVQQRVGACRQVGSLYGIGGLLVGSVGGYLLGSVAACVSFLGTAWVACVWMLEYTWEEIMVEFGEVTTSAKEGAARVYTLRSFLLC